MPTLGEYWMGRDKLFARELTDQIRANAATLIERVNLFLVCYRASTGDLTPRPVNSGWRPAAINAKVRGAAPKSKHMTGEAVDLADSDESLDTWAESPEGQKALESCKLWLESPAYTNRWIHLQSVPPKSGHRIFIP